MAFMRETPRSIAIFFFLTGAAGLASGWSELTQILKIASQPGGLSFVGELYRVIEYLFVGVAIFLIAVGARFKQTVVATPTLVPMLLVFLFLLKVSLAILLVTPQAIGGVIGSALLLTYLFFQTRRLTVELRGG